MSCLPTLKCLTSMRIEDAAAAGKKSSITNKISHVSSSSVLSVWVIMEKYKFLPRISFVTLYLVQYSDSHWQSFCLWCLILLSCFNSKISCKEEIQIFWVFSPHKDYPCKVEMQMQARFEEKILWNRFKSNPSVLSLSLFLGKWWTGIKILIFIDLGSQVCLPWRWQPGYCFWCWRW